MHSDGSLRERSGNEQTEGCGARRRYLQSSTFIIGERVSTKSASEMIASEGGAAICSDYKISISAVDS